MFNGYFDIACKCSNAAPLFVDADQSSSQTSEVDHSELRGLLIGH